MDSSHPSVICQDVPAGARFFRDVMALPVRQRGPHYAEVELGDTTAILTAPPTEPADTSTPQARGVIVKLEVPDVAAAVDELRARGANILLEPVLTEWGTESAFVAGPDACVIELFRHRGL